MTYFIRLTLIIILIPLVTFAFNSTRFGSRGFFHVQTASTLYKGTLDAGTNLNFFTKVGDYLGEAKPENFAAVNWWDVQYNIYSTYGILDNLDMTFMWRIYQDANRYLVGEGESEYQYNIPEDIFLDFKAGSFGINNNRFNLGFITSFRIPTAQNYNYYFEPYTAGGFEFGLTGLASYFNDPYLHDRSYSVHLNLGWYYHNDAGKVLYKDITGVEYKADGNASALQYGLAFSYPTELFELNLEFWGNKFINAPDSMAYSREDYMYITPSVKFKPKPWFNFNLGLDIRVSKDEDTSSKLLPSPKERLSLPNYPSWKLYLALNFRLLPWGSGFEGSKTGRSKVDFYESLLKDSRRSEKIEEELRRLRKEREQAEKELEELRQMLEEQGK
ncbi:MAG: hypothetical protein A2Y94_11040 [Caldithrix sp. RBG_13_44_9]|nr:MAG: hypothetical protein A2Y94_11040 [Caldithrix sp. RBG_13_44_9]